MTPVLPSTWVLNLREMTTNQKQLPHPVKKRVPDEKQQISRSPINPKVFDSRPPPGKHILPRTRSTRKSTAPSRKLPEPTVRRHINSPVSIEFGCSNYRLLESFLARQVDETAVTPKAHASSTASLRRRAVSRVRGYNPRTRTRHASLDIHYDIGCFVHRNLVSFSLADGWGCQADRSSRDKTRRNQPKNADLSMRVQLDNGASVKRQVLVKKRNEIQNSKKVELRAGHWSSSPDSTFRDLSFSRKSLFRQTSCVTPQRYNCQTHEQNPAIREIREDPSECIECTPRRLSTRFNATDDIAKLRWSTSYSSDVTSSGELDQATELFEDREGRSTGASRVCKQNVDANVNPGHFAEVMIKPSNRSRVEVSEEISPPSRNSNVQSFDKARSARAPESITHWSRKDTFPVFQTDARRVTAGAFETPSWETTNYSCLMEDYVVNEISASRRDVSARKEARRAKRLADLEALKLARRKSAARLSCNDSKMQLQDQQLDSKHHNPPCSQTETGGSSSRSLDYQDAESFQDPESPQKENIPVLTSYKSAGQKSKSKPDDQLYHEAAPATSTIITRRAGQMDHDRKQQLGVSYNLRDELVKAVNGVVKESVAMVKTSCNPYNDFKESMIEMIVEKDLQHSNDLEELLHCYLCLNGQQYHGVIVDVFTEIWRKLFDSDYP